MTKFLVFIFVTLAMAGCSPKATEARLADENASEVTKIFYRNLQELQGQGLMFGHQATLEYGYRWTQADLAPGEWRSDVKDVTGSFPSVYGFAVNSVVNHDWTDEQRENAIRKQETMARGIRNRGGVLTYEWHMLHPDGNRTFYNTDSVVHRILPGGDLHHVLMTSLDHAADYFHRIEDIPVIFRPWHEHNGDWFWWCRGSTSEEDFIELWRFTVDYLKNKKGVHNLIYAYSPDRSRIDIDAFQEGYMWGYPGDDYVDIIGLDNYWDLGHPANDVPPEEQLVNLRRSLEHIVKIADSKGKIAALTETGLEKIPEPRWWTDIMLSSILHNEYTKRISWFLVWRNANYEREKRDHYYVPFPGHPSADNFIEFRNHPYVRFEYELPDLYN